MTQLREQERFVQFSGEEAVWGMDKFNMITASTVNRLLYNAGAHTYSDLFDIVLYHGDSFFFHTPGHYHVMDVQRRTTAAFEAIFEGLAFNVAVAVKAAHDFIGDNFEGGSLDEGWNWFFTGSADGIVKRTIHYDYSKVRYVCYFV